MASPVPSSSSDSRADDGEQEAVVGFREPLHASPELAQVCHFCVTFQAPLKLPLVTRTDLQAALIAGLDGDERQLALLAELHYKLVRDHGVKMEKMLSDWEKAVMRKISEHWRLEFDANPFEGGLSYADVSVDTRIRVLNALCHWKLESCAEIHKHIATLQKEDDAKWPEVLRPTPLGRDDAGAVYWYLGDQCWVYAEDPPLWQHKDQRRPLYAVEFADAKRIRLSVNFDRDSTSHAIMHQDSESQDAGKLCPIAENEKSSPSVKVNDVLNPDETTLSVEKVEDVEKTGELSEVQTEETKRRSSTDGHKMDILMLCGSPVSSDEDMPLKPDPSVDQSNAPEKQESKLVITNTEYASSVEQVTNVERTETIKEEKVEAESVQVDHTVKSEGNQDEKVPATSCRRKAENNDEDTEEKPPRKRVRMEDTKDAAETNSSESSLHVDTKSPAAPVDASEAETTQPEEDNFDITCDACKRSYDRRYLDPPLDHRPMGEWRCFECLVNDARGWPRRRPSHTRASPTASSSVVDGRSRASPSSGSSSKRKSSSSSSSSKKKSKSSSSRSSSKSSSSHKKSSHHRSSSSSKDSKKSSKKKHKKKRSSSSSSSRKHHSSHRHREEYASLLSCFQSRKRERQIIEQSREHGSEWLSAEVEGPSNWRVVCSTLDGLRMVVARLAGGSMEQERLRSGLILILKEQERLEEERAKRRQSQHWDVLPRRQSSRIAISRIKSQTSSGAESESDADEGDTERNGLRRRSQRSTRASNGLSSQDSHQRLALERESRARRRHRILDSDDDDSDVEDENDGLSTDTSVNGWIDWTLTAKSAQRLTTVCLALVNRLLREQIAELFSRPVDPEGDGCPDYLEVISHPMDLGTIRERSASSFYKTWDMFKIDVERVWSNCRQYNSADTIVVQYAGTLEKLYKTMRKEAEAQGVRRFRQPLGDDDEDADNSEMDDDSVENKSRSDDSDNESDFDSPARKRKAASDDESSASEADSSEDTDDDEDDDDDDDSSDGGRRNTSRRARAASSQRTHRPTRSSRTVPPARQAPTRAARASSSRKRRRDSDDDSDESEDDDDDDDDDNDDDDDGDDSDVGRRPPRRSTAPPARSPLARPQRGSPAVKSPAANVVKTVEASVPTPTKKPVRRNRIDTSESSSSSSSDDNSSDDNDDTAARKTSGGAPATPPPSAPVARAGPATPGSPPPPPPPPPPPLPTSDRVLDRTRGGIAPLSPGSSSSSSSSYFSSSESASSSDSDSD